MCATSRDLVIVALFEFCADGLRKIGAAAGGAEIDSILRIKCVLGNHRQLVTRREVCEEIVKVPEEAIVFNKLIFCEMIRGG